MSDYSTWINDAYDEPDHNESLRKWRRLFGDKFAEGKDLAVQVASQRSSDSWLQETHFSTDAAHPDSLVERVLALGVRFLGPAFYNPPHLVHADWAESGENGRCIISASYHNHRGGALTKTINDGEPLSPNGHLKFTAGTFGLSLPKDSYYVKWRVTNTGLIAKMKGQMRGDFYVQEGHFTRWESLSYRGIHFVEAFVIRRTDGKVSAKSAPFNVVIK